MTLRLIQGGKPLSEPKIDLIEALWRGTALDAKPVVLTVEMILRAHIQAVHGRPMYLVRHFDAKRE